MSWTDAAHRHGRTACAEAQPSSSNPHPPGSELHAAWLAGWNAEFRTLPEALKAVRRAKEERSDV